MKPRYSVMRIERAKQRALTGTAFKVQRGSKDKYQIDWTGQDEERLHDLIAQWNPETGHEGLNELIDAYPFSGGMHFHNSGLKQLLSIHQGDGGVIYKDNQRQPWMATQEW